MAAVTRRKLTPWMLGVGGVTFLAGLLFGYDQGVISGALPLHPERLRPQRRSMSEIVTSWVTLGALFGALVAGGIADRIGRRWTAIARRRALRRRRRCSRRSRQAPACSWSAAS